MVSVTSRVPDYYCCAQLKLKFTSLGRVAALSQTYAVKFPLVTMTRPKFAPKSIPSRGPIPKPHCLPHPWTRPTYDAKWHPNPIRRFSTVHWTDRRTNGRTDRQTDRSSTGKFDYRPTPRERRGLKTNLYGAVKCEDSEALSL